MVFEIEFEDPLKKIMVLLYFCDQLGEYITKQYGFQPIKPIQGHRAFNLPIAANTIDSTTKDTILSIYCNKPIHCHKKVINT